MSLFLILFGGLNVTLALSFGRLYLKLTAAALLVLASAVGFYMTRFGVAIDPSIIRSVVAMEAREASALLSAGFFWHVALFGMLPALVVLFLPLKAQSWKRDVASRVTLICLSVLAPATAVYADYLELSSYAQANHHLRLFMNPLYPVYATGQFISEMVKAETEI